LLNISVSDLPAPLPAGVVAVSPTINFSITSLAGAAMRDLDPAMPGLQTRVVVDLPTGVLANTYLKWNSATASYHDFLDDQDLATYDSGATLLDLNGDGRVDRVVLTFTDGGAGDDDGVANGVVVDPGMLALRTHGVYSILLANGDRYYTASAAEAAHMSAGAANVLEGVRFDSLDASLGGRQMYANYQPFTADWYFAADGAAMPYACYMRVPGATGFMAAAAGQGVGDDYHLYLNGRGLTQLVTQQEALALNLQGQGYQDRGAVFNTTAAGAFTFDAEGYLIANHADAEVQALVQALALAYGNTSAAGFVESVEQHYLAQVTLTGTAHGGAASAADLNAVFGTHFAN
jgi:hypothetical protein